MSLVEQVTKDIADAMKQKDQAALGPLRMLKAALMNKEVERGRGLDRESSRCAGRTRTVAKRERIAPRVPCRQVTVRHADAGSWFARVSTLRGRWRRVRRINVGGRPTPRYFGAGNGARPGAHTVVSLLIPTMYGMPWAVSASRNAVTTP